MLVTFTIAGKLLSFKRIHYVGQEVLIADLPGNNSPGLFYRGGGDITLNDLQQALATCNMRLMSCTPHYYEGVAYLKLRDKEEGHAKSEGSEVPQVHLRRGLKDEEVQDHVHRFLEQDAA